MAANNPNFDKMDENPVCLQIPWTINPEMLKKWEQVCIMITFIVVVVVIIIIIIHLALSSGCSHADIHPKGASDNKFKSSTFLRIVP